MKEYTYMFLMDMSKFIFHLNILFFTFLPLLLLLCCSFCPAFLPLSVYREENCLLNPIFLEFLTEHY